MPRIKIDYVVSFSSEDPEHPASNLLAWDVSKKKWLCKRGESSCSVVLQLTKAVKISSVHIGAYHSALVEVLVARSEKASDKFEVLVPSCVFVPPGDSRRDTPVERVRSFTKDQFASDTRNQSWDRLRIVCSQPYNKHCKYGLSFVHIDESSPAPLALPLATYSSDEEEFRPGELFAQHLKNSSSQDSASDTGAQIRQATSQALKNISDASTKLMKTPITKPSTKRDHALTSERADRTRDTILYTHDDDKPHDKIDRIVQRHKEHKDKEDKAKEVKQERKDKLNDSVKEDKAQVKKDKSNDNVKEDKAQVKQEKKDKLNDSVKEDKAQVKKDTDSVNKTKEVTRTPKRRQSTTPPATMTLNKPRKHGDRAAGQKADERRKRPRLSSEDTEQVGEESTEPHTLLKDVVLVLSGYENPQRAHVRNTALALGASVRREWGPHCTHLICAFPNTPKLRQVRVASPAAPAVLAEWVLQCSARRRRVPWRWFATEPQLRRAPPPAAAPHTPRTSDTECDTDDEIEKVLRQQKAKLEEHDADGSEASADEGEATEDEAREDAAPKFGGALPDLFSGRTFLIDADEPERQRLARYVTAYGGLVVQLSQLDEEDSSIEYVLAARARASAAAGRVRGARVSPAWLARCLRAGALLAPDRSHSDNN